MWQKCHTFRFVKMKDTVTTVAQQTALANAIHHVKRAHELIQQLPDTSYEQKLVIQLLDALRNKQ